MKKVPRAKRKRLKRTTVRNSYGAGNHHFGMHGSEGARRPRLALHEHSQQEEPAHPQPAREKEIQSLPEAAYTAPGDALIHHATKDRQTPFRFPPGQPHHAAAPHRYRHGSHRL